MKKLSYLAVAAFAALCMSCQQSADSCINDMKSFVENVEKECADFTEADWEKSAAKFEKLIEKASQCEDLTNEQSQEIAKIKGQYAGVVLKQGGRELMNNVNKELEKAGKQLEGLIKGLGEE